MTPERRAALRYLIEHVGVYTGDITGPDGWTKDELLPLWDVDDRAKRGTEAAILEALDEIDRLEAALSHLGWRRPSDGRG